MSRPSRSAWIPRLVVLVLLGPALTLGVGCGSAEDAAARKAERVFRETMDKSPEYAAFALSLAGGSEDPFSRRVIVESIGSENYRTVTEAIKALGPQPPADALQPLEEQFAARKGALKLQIAVALARVGNEEALDWLRAEAKQSGGVLNPSAMEVLARHGEHESVRNSIAMLMENDDLSIRNEAYVILGEIGEPWAEELLMEGLDREHGEDRLQALVSLANAGNPDRAQVLRRFTNTQGLVFASIKGLGDLGDTDSIEHLESLAQHDEALVRVYAGAALWKLGKPDEARAVLEPLVADADPTVRRNVAEQLGDVEDDGAVPLLVQLARDDDTTVKLVALRSLVDRGGSEVQDLFVECLDDSNYEVTSIALHGLAHSASSETVSAITPLLDSGNPYTALSAAHAVLSIQGRAPVG